MSVFQSGAKLDTRTEAEKLKDFLQKEVVASAAVVNWIEKVQSAWRKFPIFNQNGSGSCVMQTETKELGIMRWLKDNIYVHFSATHGYQQRINKPEAGMGAVDAREIAKKGITLEVLTPSQNLTDQQMDSAIVEEYKRKVGEIFAVSNYLHLAQKDIDAVASTIQATGKGVMLFFYFKIEEWTEHPKVLFPNLDLNASDTLRHAVCAVDYTLVNGKKCLIIEDSWGSSFGLAGQRVIDEDFFKARNWYAGYLVNFVFDGNIIKPKHTFLTDLEFNKPNPANEVKALQDCLKYEKLFPTNTDSTGFFGAITKKAVQDFQVRYNIANALNPSFGRVGPKTRAKLNEIFST